MAVHIIHLQGCKQPFPEIRPVNMDEVIRVRGELLSKPEQPTELRIDGTILWLNAHTKDELWGGALHHIHTLTITVPMHENLSAATITALALLCPNLRCLAIYAAVDRLPDVALFPHLTKLTLFNPGTNTRAMVCSLKPFLPQLKSLELVCLTRTELCLPPQRLTALLNNGSLLLHLHLPTILTDEAVGLLLQHAPHLTHIHVLRIQLQTEEHAQSQATWQQLNCTEKLHLSSLTRLPHTTNVHLGLPKVVECDITSTESAERLQARVLGLKGLTACQCMGGHYVVLAAAKGMESAEQPAALRAGLMLLHPCAIPSTGIRCIVLTGWVMSPQLMQELSGLPAWPSLEFVRCAWAVDRFILPMLYSSLLGLLPPSVLEVILHRERGFCTRACESLCLGAEGDQEEPFHIRLHGFAPEWVESISHKLNGLGAFGNVVITGHV